MSAASPQYRFGKWKIDPHHRMLCADGAPVPLNGRAFDMLVFLVAHRDRVVSRDEIVAHVWEGLVVGENNLTVQMSTLRRVLGTDDNGAPLIVTVPGRGYQFAGVVLDDGVLPPKSLTNSSTILVEQQKTISPSPAQRRPSFAARDMRTAVVTGLFAILFCVGGAAYILQHPALKAPRLSIAVMPFNSFNPDHTQDYLADALTDDLTTDLAHIPASTVIARESASAWKGRAVSVRQIGTALGVRYLVEGSLRAEDSQFHVNVQLLDASTGAHLWADAFYFPKTSIEAVRDEITQHLATALDVRLSEIESDRSLRDRPDNPDALDLFFRARALLDQDANFPVLTAAQHLLERSLAQEPTFADAAAELGSMLVMKAKEMDDPLEIADLAEAHERISQALTLSPKNARALSARARELAVQSKWTEAEYSARAALSFDASDVSALEVLSRCARSGGHIDEALGFYKQVFRITPNAPKNKRRHLVSGYLQLLQLRPQEAWDELNQALAGDAEISSSDAMGRIEVAHLLLIATASMKGDISHATAMYTEYSRVWPHRTIFRFASYYERREAQLPGFVAILNALNSAGMPRYADEDDKIALPVNSCPGSDFDVTPQMFEAGSIWNTQQVFAHLNSSYAPLIIDIGHGAAVPPKAALFNWRQRLETATEYAQQQVQLSLTNNQVRQVVVMGDGPFGCEAFAVASTLASKYGNLQIIWYRGGEENWAKARFPAEDRRM